MLRVFNFKNIYQQKYNKPCLEINKKNLNKLKVMVDIMCTFSIKFDFFFNRMHLIF